MKRNMFFCLVLVACSSRAVTLEDLPFETVVETAGEATPKLVSYGKVQALVATNEQDVLAYPVATNALALASTALQPGATNGLLRAEADTLATAASRGGFIGTERISVFSVSSERFGVNAGLPESGTSGSFISCFGYGAGQATKGNVWSALGYLAGTGARATNSVFIGNMAGTASRGNDRLYIDVYSQDFSGYSANGAINDRIFGDTDGTLHLGRGAGAPGGAVGGTLRGPWTGGGFASYLAATNIAAAAVAGSGHLTASATNGWTTSSHDGLAASNWVESIRGVHADIATNVVYHVVVSNGHWIIMEVQ